jgi:chemotaxis protein methyltransferase CheR
MGGFLTHPGNKEGSAMAARQSSVKAYPVETELERDFVFTDKDFHFIRDLVSDKTGIVLSDIKKNMVYGRLSRRLRDLGLTRFADYCRLLDSGDDGELGEFVNAITTNLTSFFRENHHFDYLASKLLPELINAKQNRRIRIWSAGCSSGEEAYSIAMVVREVMPLEAGWDVKILATDLDSNVLARAEAGIYDSERVQGIQKNRLRKWFRKGRSSCENKVKISNDLRELICFRQLNLMRDWPLRGGFDLIFCRNVVIYFDKPTQRVLFGRFADLLAENGHLFIGHSESLFKVTDRFQLIGKTIYKKLH